MFQREDFSAKDQNSSPPSGFQAMLILYIRKRGYGYLSVSILLEPYFYTYNEGGSAEPASLFSSSHNVRYVVANHVLKAFFFNSFPFRQLL